MKKKYLITLFVFALIPAALFAGIFELGIGATTQFNPNYNPFESADFDWAQLGEFENYGFGAEVRARLLFLEVDVAGLYSYVEDSGEQFHAISGLFTGGISFDLLGFLRLGLGLGPRVNVFIDENGTTQVYMPDVSGMQAVTNFGDAFMNAPMTYRLTADFKLGKVLLGLNYTVDSDGFTFDNLDTTKLAPKFENGKIGASVIFRLF